MMRSLNNSAMPKWLQKGEAEDGWKMDWWMGYRETERSDREMKLWLMRKGQRARDRKAARSEKGVMETDSS